MPAKFPNAVWTRDEWRKARGDKSKNGMDVPQGAAKGVSIGESLDKFHKANAKGAQQGSAAATALKKDFTVYLIAVKAKYPKWHKRVENQAKILDDYMKSIGEIGKAARGYAGQYKTAVDALRDLNVDHEKNGSWDKAKAKNAEKAIQSLAETVLKMPYFTDKITEDYAGKVRSAAFQMGQSAPWNDVNFDKIARIVTALPQSV